MHINFMEKFYSQKFIRIDLRIINTEANAKRLLEENDIPETAVCYKKLFEQKSNVDILYFDSTTYTIVAYQYKREKEIKFVTEFLSHLSNSHTLKYEKRIKDENLQMDFILEKISERGIDSLSKREKEFLDEQSKK
jgi:hypothetical protein